MDTIIIMGARIAPEPPAHRWPGSRTWGLTFMAVKHWASDFEAWDAWFDPHPPEPNNWHKGYRHKEGLLDWYRKEPRGGRPIYMQKVDPLVPASVAYPLADVQAWQRARRRSTRRFGTTADYPLALAAIEAPDRVVLSGVGITGSDRYEYMHRSILYWIGVLEGQNIEVVIEGDSRFREPELLYGYDIGGAPNGDFRMVQRPKGAHMKRRRNVPNG